MPAWRKADELSAEGDLPTRPAAATKGSARRTYDDARSPEVNPYLSRLTMSESAQEFTDDTRSRQGPLGDAAGTMYLDSAAGEGDDVASDWTCLPPYSRSLLQIEMPVAVTLAQKKQRVDDIVKLVPGSIIQFEKPCDEMLELEVADQPVASGEAVKIGERFGLRVTSITLPGERFRPAQDPKT